MRRTGDDPLMLRLPCCHSFAFAGFCYLPSMTASDQPEVWLRGPVPEVLPLLQPVAHALLQAGRALAQLRGTRESALLDARGVGRRQLPSSVLGLLFHAAEHTQRHVGQIVTTARIVQALGSDALIRKGYR